MRLLLSILIITALSAGPALAQQLVIGRTLQASCYQKALHEDFSASALKLCDRALADARASLKDRAATHVNRGVILLNQDEYDDALADFQDALSMNDKLGDAYVNLAAVYVRLDRPAQAAEAATRALDFELTSPHGAYFNRAVAREELGDVAGAYQDYREAARLAPDWEAPRLELERFSVGGTG